MKKFLYFITIVNVIYQIAFSLIIGFELSEKFIWILFILRPEYLIISGPVALFTGLFSLGFCAMDIADVLSHNKKPIHIVIDLIVLLCAIIYLPFYAYILMYCA